MSAEKPTAIVYIDGLNLYRYLKAAYPGKQRVDLLKLCQNLFPALEVKEIKYFTAMMKTLDGNAEPSIKQSVYLDHLRRSDSKISILFGRIRIDTRIYPKSPRTLNAQGEHQTVKIFKFEEKETDVNIAATIVADASQNLADNYLLVSSDTDFNPLKQIMVSRMGANYGQTSVRKIPADVIEGSQFTR